MIEGIYLQHYHNQIGRVKLSHCCHIFPWLCAWDACTTICCWSHIYPGKASFVPFILCSFKMCAQKTNTLWSDGRMRLFALYATSLSLWCRRICRYWTSKILVSCTLPSVCLRFRQFSQSSSMQYVGQCVFRLPISLMVIVRICVLYLVIIIKSEVWHICHYFRVMSWNNGMRCVYSYILIAVKHFPMKIYM